MPLQEIADGVLVHESACIQSNCVIVRGDEGALLIDPGITRDELAGIARALDERGLPVVAGFATHPDWDHVLWHPALGDAQRYGTADCAATIRAFVGRDGWRAELADYLPPEFADDIPMELLGDITPLSPGAAHIPWAGPRIRIIEHRAHAPGHAALLIEDAGVLVAGDMLSDALIPFLDLDAAQPLDDYLGALSRFEEIADAVRTIVPGHGSVGDGQALRDRIALDTAYIEALQRGREPDDPRIGPDAPLDWMADVHRAQLQRLRDRIEPR
ncbi:Glyoxylase, beta-lactamase superfamily II [Agrococcus baldri]|uniref:Glyoxylase, beta-lactamase superfamily II n=1 Tax=Agrococcus baldri TaxID=153730 RepID=A0AA94HP98_9MICO|nr:MBL fold metallo-hydrolase [Agrococcus baldri]SFS18176.1 Glyoxylase, beta-lactamase superfamily II [Agrococcus baldri]